MKRNYFLPSLVTLALLLIFSENAMAKKSGFTRQDNVTYYLGIPFAKPPVGELRFKAPVPIDDGKPLDRLPPNPVQDTWLDLEMSEDCLYLNIFAPKDQPKDKPLPVVVWVYGGSYATGGIGEKAAMGFTYDMGDYAVDTNSLVVAVNYRVNALGFADFTAFGSEFESNLGLKDIVAALGWVKRNIAKYNGDPQNVTLQGQSAGAALIAALMNVEEAKDLFQRVIMESPCLESFYDKEEAKEFAAEYLKHTGGDAAALTAMPALDLVKPTKEMDKYVRHKKMGTCSFNPVVDGSFLKEFPSKKILYPKPVILGTNKNESIIFAKFSKLKDFGKAEHTLPFAEPANRSRIFAAYSKHYPTKKAVGNLLTDTMYTVPKYRYATLLTANDLTYLYRFDFYSGMFRTAGIKASHMIEMFPLFNKGLKYFGVKRKKAFRIGAAMREQFGAFIHGEPMPCGENYWKPYDQLDQNVLVIKDDTCNQEINPDKMVIERFSPIEHILLK